MAYRKDWFLAVVLGLSIPFAVIALDGMETKLLVFALLLMVIFCVIAPLKNKEQLFLYLFALVLCVKLEKNFFISEKYLQLSTTSAGFGIALSDIFLAFLYFFWWRRSWRSSSRLDRRLIIFFAVYMAFLALIFVSLANSESLILSLYEFKKRAQVLFILIYISMNVRSLAQIKGVVMMLFAGIILSSSVALLQYKTGGNLGLRFLGEADTFYNQGLEGSSEVIRRVSGLMPHSNSFGMYLCLLLPIAISLSLSNIEKKVKYISFLAATAGLLGLTLSFSRAAIIGFVLAMILLMILRFKSIFSSGNRIQILLYGVILTMGLSVFIGKIIGRFTSTTAMNMDARYMLNEAAFRMIGAHPFAGIGLNNFGPKLDFYDVHGITQFARYPAHNIYLLIAAETGFISMCVFVSFIVMVVVAGMRAGVSSGDHFIRAFATGASCGILAVMLQGMVDFSMLVPVFYVLFFVICALILAARYTVETPGAAHV